MSKKRATFEQLSLPLLFPLRLFNFPDHLRILFNEKTLQLMAILALCTSLKDMKERISRIVVAKLMFMCKLPLN